MLTYVEKAVLRFNMGVELVKKFFEEKGISKEIVFFDKSTENSMKAAETLGVEQGQIAKSILFLADGVPLLIVISGDKRVDEKKIKKLVSAKKVRMARADEVYNITGYEVGGVSPVGHKTSLKIFVDESLKRYDEIYPAAGESNNMFPTTFSELVSLTGGSIVDVAKEF
ncbi:MAG: YbaK/EbsC family protein [Proteobacteria bacterium]|nr:YbaK/EbsC family protein [Pseudomonadota bacterium]